MCCEGYRIGNTRQDGRTDPFGNDHFVMGRMGKGNETDIGAQKHGCGTAQAFECEAGVGAKDLQGFGQRFQGRVPAVIWQDSIPLPRSVMMPKRIAII